MTAMEIPISLRVNPSPPTVEDETKLEISRGDIPQAAIKLGRCQCSICSRVYFLASFPSLPHFVIWFAFSIIYASEWRERPDGRTCRMFS